ncbi:MAG: hypothetical protein ACE5D7_03380, partial [Fidelibacterota bacterium]
NLLKEMGAELTMAIDVNIQQFRPINSPTLFKIMSRVEQVTSSRINDLMKNNADFTIRPETKNLFWTEFERIDELVSNGYESICNIIDSIKSKYIKPKRFIELFKNIIKSN